MTALDSNGSLPEAGKSFLGLPAALAGRQQHERQLETRGTKADKPTANSRQRSGPVEMKLYQEGVAPKPGLMEMMATPDGRYGVQRIDSARSAGEAYEFAGFAADESFARPLSRRQSRSEPREEVKRVDEAVPGFDGLRKPPVHCDSKPANILMRHTKPVERTLSGFGLAPQLRGGLRRATRPNRTIENTPPEVDFGDRSIAAEGCSLKIMIAKPAGQQTFFGTIGHQIYQRATTSHKVQTEWYSADNFVATGPIIVGDVT